MPRRDLGSRIDEMLASLAKEIAAGKGSAIARSCEGILAECQKNEAVQKACEVAGVDRNDPNVLAALLIGFASARFGKGKPGRDKKWDSIMLSVLFNAYQRLRTNSSGKISDTKIFEQLSKLNSFKGDSPRTLRRKFVDAVDPDCNLLLKHVLASWQTKGITVRRRQRSLPDWKDVPDRAVEAKIKFHRIIPNEK